MRWLALVATGLFLSRSEICVVGGSRVMEEGERERSREVKDRGDGFREFCYGPRHAREDLALHGWMGTASCTISSEEQVGRGLGRSTGEVQGGGREARAQPNHTGCFAGGQGEWALHGLARFLAGSEEASKLVEAVWLTQGGACFPSEVEPTAPRAAADVGSGKRACSSAKAKPPVLVSAMQCCR